MADRNNDKGQKTLLFWKQSNLYEMVDHWKKGLASCGCGHKAITL
jgi:hypothetical protein